MDASLEQALLTVWRQALVDKADIVVLNGQRYPVTRTPRRGLRQVDFLFDRIRFRGLEQNAATSSRWAQEARSGKKVMQFLQEGHYVAAIVEGKITWYGLR